MSKSVIYPGEDFEVQFKQVAVLELFNTTDITSEAGKTTIQSSSSQSVRFAVCFY